MSTIERNRKVGGTNQFHTEWELGFDDIRADEVDADFNTLVDAWNTQIPDAVLSIGIPPAGPAGGDLEGVFPTPSVKSGAITRAKTASDLWLPPIPTDPDVGKVLTVTAGPALSYVVAQGPPGPGVAPGGTVGQVLSKVSAADYATDWTTLPTSLPPSGGASGALTGSYPAPGLADNAVVRTNIAAGHGLWVYDAITGPASTITLTTVESYISGKAINVVPGRLVLIAGTVRFTVTKTGTTVATTNVIVRIYTGGTATGVDGSVNMGIATQYNFGTVANHRIDVALPIISLYNPVSAGSLVFKVTAYTTDVTNYTQTIAADWINVRLIEFL